MKINAILRRQFPALLLGMVSLLIAPLSVRAGVVTKSDTGTDLNDPASWTGSATPTAADVATWSGTALGASLTLGANTNWLGINVAGAASDIDISGAGNLSLGANGVDASLTTVNLTLGVPLTLTANQTWTVASGFSISNSAAISGAFALTKAGAGSLTLSGANTYTGGTTLQGPSGTVLQLYHSSALGTGPLNLKSTSTSAGATIRLYGGIVITNPISIDSTTGREAIWSYSGNNTLAGPITFTAGTSAFNFSSSAEAGTTLAISNSISGPSYTGAFSLRGNAGNFGVIAGQVTLNSVCQIIGGCNWTIYSTGNTWTQTRLSPQAGDGGFVLGTNDALATGARITWDNNSSATVDLAGFNQTVAGLDCASTTVTPPTLVNNSASSDSLLKINGGGYTYVGTLADGSTRKLAIELLSGIQTLTGANTYTGNTTISGGTLRVNGSLAAGSAVTVKTNAILAGSGTVNGPVTVNRGGALVAGDASGAGNLTLGSLTLGATAGDLQNITVSPGSTAINVVGALVNNGTNIINIVSVGSVTPGSYQIISYNGPTVITGFALGTLPSRMTATLQYTAGAIYLNVTSSADSIKWTGAESSLWNSTAVNWQLISGGTPTTYFNGTPGDAVLFDDTLTGTSNIVLNTAVTPANVVFSNFTTAYRLGGTGGITGTNNLIKVGTNALTLTTSNSFSGVVIVTGGSLIITNASALGSGTKILTVKSAVPNNAELHLNGSSGPVVLPSTFRFDTYGDVSYQGNIVNDSGDNIVNSSLNMNSGGGNPKIAVLGGSLTFNGDIWTTNGSSAKVMQLAGVGTGIINGVIRNGNRATGLSVLGGTWILNNTNTYTSATGISTNASLVVNGGLVASAVTVQNGGQLRGNGTLGGATTVQLGGTLAPGNSVGILTVSNTLTLQGTVIMEIARNGSSVTNDQVNGISTLNYGGTLVVTNIGSSALQVGDSFKLFAATTYGATAFTNIVYPAGYTFTDNLASSGTITVLTVPSTGSPVLGYTPSGANWVFNWSGSGFKLQTQTNSLSVGLGTNWSDVPGGNTSGVSVPAPVVGNPAVFFRLISTP